MNKVSDFFKEIGHRMRNPLIYSFILSWFIFNWRIIIALCFYRFTDLKIDGYQSYIDMIEKEATQVRTLWGPLVASLIYTFVFPFFRNWIIASQSWYAAWGSKLNYKASRETNIPISKFISLREIYLDLSKTLETLIKDESGYRTKNDELNAEQLKLTKVLNDSKREVANFVKGSEASFLNGSWYITTQELTNEPIILSGGNGSFDDKSQYTIAAFDVFQLTYDTTKAFAKVNLFKRKANLPRTNESEKISLYLFLHATPDRYVGWDQHQGTFALTKEPIKINEP